MLIDLLPVEAHAIWAVERSEELEGVYTGYDQRTMTAFLRLDMPGDLHISAGFHGVPWHKMPRDERHAAIRAAATGKDNEFWRAVAAEGFATIYDRAGLNAV